MSIRDDIADSERLGKVLDGLRQEMAARDSETPISLERHAIAALCDVCHNLNKRLIKAQKRIDELNQATDPRLMGAPRDR